MSKPIQMGALPMTGAPKNSEKATAEIQGFVDKVIYIAFLILTNKK